MLDGRSLVESTLLLCNNADVLIRPMSSWASCADTAAGSGHGENPGGGEGLWTGFCCGVDEDANDVV